jgi:hypothetical protein
MQFSALANSDSSKVLSIAEYFEGDTLAYGILEDFFGRPTRRFKVKMQGHWEGTKGVLNEEFLFDDGELQKRTWNFEHIAPNQFIGSAADVIGLAKGNELPGEINMSYTLRVPVDKKNYDLKFDDRLYIIEDNIVLNKAKMKKFGITVATLTLVFTKK